MIKIEKYDYYIKPGYTDLRKGALKLSLIVQDGMEMNPFSKSIFMFCSKNRKTIKAILWDGNGWFEITKRLDYQSRFSWPKTEESSKSISLDEEHMPAIIIFSIYGFSCTTHQS